MKKKKQNAEFKISYEEIAKAIFHKIRNRKKADFRDLVREWIVFLESYKLKGWNRDKFLDAVIVAKKEFEEKREKRRKKK